MNQEKYDQAKNYALYLLSYRERSQQEIRDRLLKKGYSNDIANRVICRLSELNYLNDHRFSELWVRNRIKNYPRGRLLIKKELGNKGINPAVIEPIVDRLLSLDKELELGKILAQKWLKKRQTDDKLVLRLKIYLHAKGFSTDCLETIISDLSL